jgi:hypothetical protein
MRIPALIAAIALAMPVAAPAPAAPAKRAGAADPLREICKSRPVVGSRLKRIRECHTAAEWDDLELQKQVGMARRQGNGDAGCNYDTGGTQCGVLTGGRDTPW